MRLCGGVGILCGGVDSPKNRKQLRRLFPGTSKTRILVGVKFDNSLFLNGLKSHSIPLTPGPLHMLICLPGSRSSSPITELMTHYILLMKGKGWMSPHPQL